MHRITYRIPGRPFTTGKPAWAIFGREQIVLYLSSRDYIYRLYFMTQQQPPRPGEQSQPFTRRQLIALAARNWYWFLLSVVLFLGISKLVSGRILTSQNEYFGQIAVRSSRITAENGLMTNPAEEDPRYYTPSWKKYTRLQVDRVKEVLETTTILQQAARQVQLDVDYFTSGLPLLKRNAYNQTPYRVQIPDALPSDRFSFSLKWSGNPQSPSFTLSSFSGLYHNQDIPAAGAVSATLNTPVQTPVGTVVIIPDDPALHYPAHVTDAGIKQLTVVKSPFNDVVRSYDSEIELKAKATAVRIDMVAGGSERKALELLNAMFDQLDTILRAQIGADLQEQTRLLAASLQALDTIPAGEAAPGQASLRQALTQQLAQARIEQGILEQTSTIDVIDPARVKAAGIPVLYLHVLAFLLGLLLPLLIIYIIWVYKGALRYRDELPPYLNRRLVTEIPLNRYISKKDPSVFDELSLLLKEAFSAHQVVAFVTPSRTRRTEQFIKGLTESYRSVDPAFVTMEFRLPDYRAKKSGNAGMTVVLEPGQLVSGAIEAQIKEATQRYHSVALFLPAASKSNVLYSVCRYAGVVYAPLFADKTKLSHMRSFERGVLLRPSLKEKLHTLWVH